MNKCYKLPDARCVPEPEPVGSPGRIVKEVEAHFATLPPDAPDYDHYGPAEFLVENGAEVRRTLPDLGDALDRFERLFRDLNQLLPKP